MFSKSEAFEMVAKPNQPLQGLLTGALSEQNVASSFADVVKEARQDVAVLCKGEREESCGHAR